MYENADGFNVTVSIVIFSAINLPFNEVDQTAGTATTVPERSPHGIH